MSQLKYIKLFEEHQDGSTWSTVRDVIQEKKPFLLVVCEDDDSCMGCRSALSAYNVIDQTAYLTEDGENIELPSLFAPVNKDTNLDDLVKTLFNKFSIKRIVTGDNAEFIKMYYDATTQQNLGNELISDLSPQSMPPDDYFKIDSTYYKFINFNV